MACGRVVRSEKGTASRSDPPRTLIKVVKGIDDGSQSGNKRTITTSIQHVSLARVLPLDFSHSLHRSGSPDIVLVPPVKLSTTKAPFGCLSDDSSLNLLSRLAEDHTPHHNLDHQVISLWAVWAVIPITIIFSATKSGAVSKLTNLPADRCGTISRIEIVSGLPTSTIVHLRSHDRPVHPADVCPPS